MSAENGLVALKELEDVMHTSPDLTDFLMRLAWEKGSRREDVALHMMRHARMLGNLPLFFESMMRCIGSELVQDMAKEVLLDESHSQDDLEYAYWINVYTKQIDKRGLDELEQYINNKLSAELRQRKMLRDPWSDSFDNKYVEFAKNEYSAEVKRLMTSDLKHSIRDRGWYFTFDICHGCAVIRISSPVNIEISVPGAQSQLELVKVSNGFWFIAKSRAIGKNRKSYSKTISEGLTKGDVFKELLRLMIPCGFQIKERVIPKESEFVIQHFRWAAEDTGIDISNFIIDEKA